jgi:hypothetical protein
MVLTSLNEVNLRNRRNRTFRRQFAAFEKGHPDCAIVTLDRVSEAGQEGGGLLGDLPSHRPSVRSPRREAAAARAEKAAAAASGRAGGKGARPASTAPNTPDQRPSGAEQLARAGAGLALAPARIGLRLAGRAVDGLGKAVGRN